MDSEKQITGLFLHRMIFDPIGHEKSGSLERGGANTIFIEKADDVKVEEGNMAQSSSKIKTIIGRTDTSVDTGRSNAGSRKRSSRQNQKSSLPVKKRLKLGGRYFVCQEEEKEECEEDEFDESEDEEEVLEEARRNDLLVMEHQALLWRKIGLLKNDDPSKTKSSLPVKKRLKLGGRYFVCQEEEKEVCEEDEFYESEDEEEAVEEARRDDSLVMEHQALLRTRMGLLKNDDPSKEAMLTYALV